MPQSRDHTARLAKALWKEGHDLEPAAFQACFDALYAASERPATLWHLGGAANDFLRVHPNSIQVPPELAPALVASKIVDGRIVGLKLLNRCAAEISVISPWICRALESRHESELYGGLFELDNLLRRLEPSARLPRQEILPRLSKLSSSADEHVRRTSARLADWILEFGEG